MQSTGHSSMQALSLTSTHGRAMTYVTWNRPPSRGSEWGPDITGPGILRPV
ncbi:hypothetical protein ACFFX0_07935 [Citricoccus parietis]|uniref:Uncharacterized protein n=1 Tax=Citricoccus parietis TaxID=592307 RepID=A0ABV5FWR3_9MICC